MTAKTAEDYLLQAIRIAKLIKKDLESVDETGKTRNILNFFKALQQINIEQLRQAKLEIKSKKLIKECGEVLGMVTASIESIENRYSFEIARQTIDRIIALESYIYQDFEKEIKFIPSKELNKIINYSPKEAVSKGYIFRGVSDEDFDKIMRGQDIYARVPDGKVPLLRHVLDPTNNQETQFISLTADSSVARNFGRIIAIKINGLKGNLIPPKEVIARTHNETKAARLVKKNTEFILEPTRLNLACIPASAVVK